MQFTGLSLDQAPPLQSVILFFLWAPFFAFLASITLFFMDASTLLALNTPQTIALVHLFTLGFICMVIFGALQQMLPVIAGVSLPFAKTISLFVFTTLFVGLLSFFIGFYFDLEGFLHPAGLFLFLSFTTLFTLMLFALRAVEMVTATILGMRIVAIFALATAVLGLIALFPYLGQSSLATPVVHMIIAVFGVAVLLIVALSFQIIPMFYVAEAFKPFCRHYVLAILTVSLILWALSELFFPRFRDYFKFTELLFLLAFAVALVRKLKNRRRPIIDVTVYFWYSAALLLALGMLVWLTDLFSQNISTYTKALFVLGFVLSVINAMLYKIVPFLVWFHLNAKGYFSILTMRELLHEGRNYTQYGSFILGLAALFLLPLFPWMLYVGATLWSLSFSLLGVELLALYNYYKKVIKTKPDLA